MEYKIKIRRANTKEGSKNPKYNMMYIDLGWRVVPVTFNLRDMADIIDCLPGELVTEENYEKEVGTLIIGE